jgi:hypothetical protein
LQGAITSFEVDHGEAVGAPAAVDYIASSHDVDTDSERPTNSGAACASNARSIRALIGDDERQ